MSILRGFESRLERAVEGFFSKAFRSGLQPVELAKRVLREMEAGKTVGVREVWVPNRYLIRLSAEDGERLAGMEGALSKELEQVVVEGARERGWGLVARPEVTFETADALKRGDFRVEAEHSEATGPPSEELPAGPGAGPALVVIADGSVVGRYPLRGAGLVIGRHAGSDVQLEDPGASRRHAEVLRRGDDFVVADLGSTNGTLVNDAPVSEHVLDDGDRITIGTTVLEFRKG